MSRGSIRRTNLRQCYLWSVRVLLFSMPDSFEHTPSLAMRMPNGALASLAGNLDPAHEVAIADLILAQSAVRATVEQLVRDHRPDIVGLSVMTFQRSTARRVISLVRSLRLEDNDPNEYRKTVNWFAASAIALLIGLLIATVVFATGPRG